VKSFVFRSDRPFNPAKLEDFLGAIVQVYGPKMLRYKGVLNMKGTDKKVIFQGVHQLMGSDLGPQVGSRREEDQQDGVHRHRPAQGHLPAGTGRLPGLAAARPKPSEQPPVQKPAAGSETDCRNGRAGTADPQGNSYRGAQATWLQSAAPKFAPVPKTPRTERV
jgi:hypothetical protein